jgi:hypothetical protein
MMARALLLPDGCPGLAWAGLGWHGLPSLEFRLVLDSLCCDVRGGAVALEIDFVDLCSDDALVGPLFAQPI